MKFAEINAIFTSKVAEYIAQGYTINTNTMAGHQGEIGKVDLRKGEEVIRVLLDTEHRNLRDAVILIVGRNTDESIAKSTERNSWDTIWNNQLEIIEKRTFWQMEKDYRGVDYYLEDKEGLEAIERSHSRRNYEADLHPRMDYSNNDAVKAAILPAVRRHLDKPRMKADRIATVIRKWDEGRYNYYVTTKGGSHVTLH